MDYQKAAKTYTDFIYFDENVAQITNQQILTIFPFVIDCLEVTTKISKSTFEVELEVGGKVFTFPMNFLTTTHKLYCLIRLKFHLNHQFTIFMETPQGRVQITDFSPLPDEFFVFKTVTITFTSGDLVLKWFSDEISFTEQFVNNVDYYFDQCYMNSGANENLQCLSYRISKYGLEHMFNEKTIDDSQYYKYMFHQCYLLREHVISKCNSQCELLNCFPLACTYPNYCFAEQYSKVLEKIFFSYETFNHDVYIDCLKNYITNIDLETRHNARYPDYIGQILFKYLNQLDFTRKDVQKITSEIKNLLFAIPTLFSVQIPKLFENKDKIICSLIHNDPLGFFEDLSYQFPFPTETPYSNLLSFVPPNMARIEENNAFNSIMYVLFSINHFVNALLSTTFAHNPFLYMLQSIVLEALYGKRKVLKSEYLYQIMMKQFNSELSLQENCDDLFAFILKHMISEHILSSDTITSTIRNTKDSNDETQQSIFHAFYNEQTTELSFDNIIPILFDKDPDCQITSLAPVLIIRLVCDDNDTLSPKAVPLEIKGRSLNAFVCRKVQFGKTEYVTFIKRANLWFCCSDLSVSLIDWRSVPLFMENNDFMPYMAFYNSYENISMNQCLINTAMDIMKKTLLSSYFNEKSLQEVEYYLNDEDKMYYDSFFSLISITRLNNDDYSELIQSLPQTSKFKEVFFMVLFSLSKKYKIKIIESHNFDILKAFMDTCRNTDFNIEVKKLAEFDTMIKEYQTKSDEKTNSISQQNESDSKEETNKITIIDSNMRVINEDRDKYIRTFDITPKYIFDISEFELYLYNCVFKKNVFDSTYAEKLINTCVINHDNSILYGILLHLGEHIQMLRYDILDQFLLILYEKHGKPVRFTYPNPSRYLCHLYSLYQKKNDFFDNYKYCSSLTVIKERSTKDEIEIARNGNQISKRPQLVNFPDILAAAASFDNAGVFFDKFDQTVDIKKYVPYIIKNGSLAIFEMLGIEWDKSSILTAIQSNTIAIFEETISFEMLLDQEIVLSLLRNYNLSFIIKICEKKPELLYTFEYMPGQSTVFALGNLMYNTFPIITASNYISDLIISKNLKLEDLGSICNTFSFAHSSDYSCSRTLLAFLLHQKEFHTSIMHNEDFNNVLLMYLFCANNNLQNIDIEYFVDFLYIQGINEITSNADILQYFKDVMTIISCSTNIFDTILHTKRYNYIYPNTFELLSQYDKVVNYFDVYEDIAHLIKINVLGNYPSMTTQKIGYLIEQDLPKRPGCFITIKLSSNVKLSERYNIANVTYQNKFILYQTCSSGEKKYSFAMRFSGRWIYYDPTRKISIMRNSFEEIERMKSERALLVIAKRCYHNHIEFTYKASTQPIDISDAINNNSQYIIKHESWQMINDKEDKVRESFNHIIHEKDLEISLDDALKQYRLIKNQFIKRNPSTKAVVLYSVEYNITYYKNDNRVVTKQLNRQDIDDFRAKIPYPCIQKKCTAKYELAPLFIPPSQNYQIIAPYDEIKFVPSSDIPLCIGNSVTQDLCIPQSIRDELMLQEITDLEIVNPWLIPSKNERVIPDSSVWYLIPPHKKWCYVLPYDMILASSNDKFELIIQNSSTWSANSIAKLYDSNDLELVNVESFLEENELQKQNALSFKGTNKKTIIARIKRRANLLSKEALEAKLHYSNLIKILYSNKVTKLICQHLARKEFHINKSYSADDRSMWLSIKFSNPHIIPYLIQNKLAPASSTFERWKEELKKTLPSPEIWQNHEKVSQIIKFWIETFNIDAMNAIIAVDAMHLTLRLEINENGEMKGTTKKLMLTQIEMKRFKSMNDFYKFTTILDKNGLMARAVFVILLIPLSHSKPLPIHYHFSDSGSAKEEENKQIKDILALIKSDFPQIKLFGRAHDADPQYDSQQKEFYKNTTEKLKDNDYSLKLVIQNTCAEDLISADAPHVLKRFKNRIVTHKELESFCTTIQIQEIVKQLEECNIPSKATSSISTDKMVDRYAKDLFTPNVVVELIKKEKYELVLCMLPGVMMRIVYYCDTMTRNERLFILVTLFYMCYLLNLVSQKSKKDEVPFLFTEKQLTDMANTTFQMIYILLNVSDAYSSARNGSTEVEHYFSTSRRLANEDDTAIRFDSVFLSILANLVLNKEYTYITRKSENKPAIIEEGLANYAQIDEKSAMYIASSSIIMIKKDITEIIPKEFHNSEKSVEIYYMQLLNLLEKYQDDTESLKLSTNYSILDGKKREEHITRTTFHSKTENLTPTFQAKEKQFGEKVDDIHKLLNVVFPNENDI